MMGLRVVCVYDWVLLLVRDEQVKVLHASYGSTAYGSTWICMSLGVPVSKM